MDHPLLQSVREGDREAVFQQLNHDPNQYIADDAFLLAAELGFSAIVTSLLDPPRYNLRAYKVYIHLSDKNGPDAALRLASQNGHDDTLKVLLDPPSHGINLKGIRIDSRNNEALRLAARYGHTSTVALLLDPVKHGLNLKWGADVHAKNDEALRRAAIYGHEETVSLLLNPRSYGLDSDGADVHARDVWGPDAPLIWAAAYGHQSVVRLLLENGADIHARSDFLLSNTARHGHLAVVRLLLENGADIHACNNYALHKAALAFDSDSIKVDVIRLLLHPRKYGLDLTGCDPNVLILSRFNLWPKIHHALQIFDQKELYNKARVMYYALTFAQQHKYSIGGCGALIQALNFGL